MPGPEQAVRTRRGSKETKSPALGRFYSGRLASALESGGRVLWQNSQSMGTAVAVLRLSCMPVEEDSDEGQDNG